MGKLLRRVEKASEGSKGGRWKLGNDYSGGRTVGPTRGSSSVSSSSFLCLPILEVPLILSKISKYFVIQIRGYDQLVE